MSKKIVTANGDVASTVPSVKGAKPIASLVLVEILTPQEQLGGRIELAETVDIKECAQGYVLDVGPSFKPLDWGFNVGDRVMLQGNFNMLPNYDHSHRMKAIMEPHGIRSVLLEK